MENPYIATLFIDLKIEAPLDYVIPPHLVATIVPGSRVVIPLKGKSLTGTVVAIKRESSIKTIKPILENLPHSIPPDLLKLATWMAQYYCSPFYKVIKTFLPPPIQKKMKEQTQLFVQSLYPRKELAKIYTTKRGPQAKILEILLQKPKGMLLSRLLELSQTSRSPVTILSQEKIVSLSPITIDRSLCNNYDFFPTKNKTLNPEQETTLAKILKKLPSFETHLIHGITGSGKTEIYLQAIEAAIKKKKSAIFLVPEIALTSQTIERLRSRFQEKVAVLHHRLNAGTRRDTWHKIYEGGYSLIVGPRSAIFSPAKNLGLIIVDEEHDFSYKQTEEMPCYHARDIAIMRGKFSDATVILGTATPSLESYHNATIGKYHLSNLTIRADNATLPTIHLVDMNLEKEKKNSLFSDKLLNSIEKKIDIGEQSIIFLNRRGFNTEAMCKNCEASISCCHCSITLTFYKNKNLLACHLCGYQIPPPRRCPSCKNEGELQFKGVGTELVEKSLHAIFPQIRTIRIDGDTTRHKGSHEQLFKQFRAGKADILIGTQMIAKGLHFPSVTLVGMLNADASLYIPDFRSAEQTFQLITQVSGRSGRGSLPGEVILQTKLPTHTILRNATSLNYTAFFQEELQIRKTYSFPPICHLIKIIFNGKHLSETTHYAEDVRSILIKRLPPNYQLYPIVPCGYAKIKDRFRLQCLIKGSSPHLIGEIIKTLKKQNDIHLLIDVDPTTTFF
jgi:primosomal protein N' (replication factor Y) (superfamily II helicase)